MDNDINDLMRVRVAEIGDELVRRKIFASKDQWFGAAMKILGKDPASRSVFRNFLNYHQVAKGTRSMTIENYWALAKAAGMTLPEFFGGIAPRDYVEKELIDSFRRSDEDGKKIALSVLKKTRVET